MFKPIYEINNIVNLMSSISNAYNKPHLYNTLGSLPPSYLKQFDNVILVVIDGLGYNYLSNKNDSFLYEHLKSKMSGAFPLTTASSNSVFNYGVPAQQHGLTGWHVFLKEIGVITTVLPFSERYFGTNLVESGFKVSNIFGVDAFTKGLSTESYKLLDKMYSHSEYSIHAGVGSKIISTTPMENTFEKIKEIIIRNSNKKYIHAYIGDFDASGHIYGVESEKSDEVFRNLDNQIKEFSNDLKNTNSIILVTADHGMKDALRDEIISISDYPEIEECLSIPLTGDSRTRYAYVRPSKVSQFEKEVLDKLSEYCNLYKSEDLVENNWFGLFSEHKNLRFRVGDYTLIMKDSYVLLDYLQNENPEYLIGHHAGVSDDEIFVPLVVIEP